MLLFPPSRMVAPIQNSVYSHTELCGGRPADNGKNSSTCHFTVFKTRSFIYFLALLPCLLFFCLDRLQDGQGLTGLDHFPVDDR